MTGKIIFNIKFGELLNFVNIFCSVRFNFNKLHSSGSRVRLKIESQNRSKEKLACQSKPVKTLTRKLDRKNSFKNIVGIFDHQLVEKK
jgi:hypothetical protein